MGRLTVTPDDHLHRTLKEGTARRGRFSASTIKESLRLRGIQVQASAPALVAEARERAQLDPDTALELAVGETRAARKVPDRRLSPLLAQSLAVRVSRSGGAS